MCFSALKCSYGALRCHSELLALHCVSCITVHFSTALQNAFFVLLFTATHKFDWAIKPTLHRYLLISAVKLTGSLINTVLLFFSVYVMIILWLVLRHSLVHRLIDESFFFCTLVYLTSELNEKYWLYSPIKTVDVNEGILPAELLYSDSEETFLLSEYTDQSVQPPCPIHGLKFVTFLLNQPNRAEKIW